MFPAAAIAGILAGLGLHWGLWRLLRPARPVGDEVEYLATHPSPHERGLWVRVPLYGLLIRATRRLGAAPDFAGPRAAVGLMSALSVGLAAAWADAQAGSTAGWIAAAAMLLCLERGVLALHLWSDIAMGLLVLAFAILLHRADAPIATAMVAALALGVRAEGAVLCLIAALAPLLAPDPSVTDAALCAVVGVAALCLYTAMNGLRHGVWRADTTLAFNIRVAGVEQADAGLTVQEAMAMAMRRHMAGDPADAPGWPGIARRIPVRFRQLAGPETFVSQNLLPGNHPRYAAHRSLLAAGPAAGLLRHGFPVVAALTFAVLPVTPLPPLATLAALAATYCGLQCRSRYRMALLPLMAAMIGMGIVRTFETPQALPILSGAALAAGYVVAMIRLPERRESRPVQ